MYCTLREYSIIESGLSFIVKPVSDSLGKSNGLLVVNNIICYLTVLWLSGFCPGLPG